MLTYKLIEVNGDEYIYEYYPDGKEEFPGKVSISRNGEKSIIETSGYDFGNRYANHALAGIDMSKKSGTVAWY
ncbi:MAG: hypothetical protein HFI70_04030 [Lachnospiraceae bacterium]|nr:hypothetical protein [Lachnospiraceae bacterium]